MWSSSSEEQQHQHHYESLNKNLGTLSSKSSSSSTSSSSYNHPNNPIFNKAMEEVWKDINLSCSKDHIDPQNTTNSSTNFCGRILQDFLARPFANEPPTTTTAYGSPAAPPPPHVTMLTLNSGPELHFFSNLNPLRQSSVSQQKVISNALGGGNGNGNGRKRYPRESDNINSGDLKNKRMIKNRESAARSRARKQESLAYTNELEMEVANLVEENARLKRQQQQLCLASTAQHPKKNSLYRTSTAPF
ncbi:protein FD-like [Lycium ferocissimum]|uniref:protein FD-like n=1 Tax=Lycium ferocissimum TaxID=112874 RepID=UPI002815BAEC|nr:protein FD-like [Lycium ferocissimum]